MDYYNLAYLLVGLIIGFVSGIYLPIKFRSEDKTPKISVSPFQERQNYFDITNHGGDLLDMEINISWLQDGKSEPEHRTITNFFYENEDPAMGHHHKCNSLKKGETQKATECPSYSNDGEVNINVTGKNIDGAPYERALKIKTGTINKKSNPFNSYSAKQNFR